MDGRRSHKALGVGSDPTRATAGIVDQLGRVASLRTRKLRVQISPMPPGGNMETLVVEIHAAEGGADAKLLIVEQLGVYKKYCIRRHL